jgi:peptidyl-prolyl cis-trans isomerase A (cyclophilin A)
MPILALALATLLAAPANRFEPSKLAARAPAVFKVKFATSKGPFVVEVHRDWAPLGADRFYNLVKRGYYDNARFFRVLKGFMVQFGIHAEPSVNAALHAASIQDDPVKESNKRGTVTFATSGPNSRTTQLFINYGDNARLDPMGFAPFGKVVSGMEAVDAIDGQYGERPDQGRMEGEGNAYLAKEFPSLDFIKKAQLVK